MTHVGAFSIRKRQTDILEKENAGNLAFSNDLVIFIKTTLEREM